MSETTVGIIGAGAIASTMHIPVLRAMPQFRIAWLTDSNSVRGRSIAAANALPFVELPNDPASLPPCEMVGIAIPLIGRQRYFDQYAGTSTAVMAEKPLSITAEEHMAIASTFDPWRLTVCYIRRTYATSRMLRQAIRSGAFGQLEEIIMAEGGRGTKTGGGGTYQDEGVAEGGGITKNLGCHAIDAVLWTTGATNFRIESRSMEWDGATDRQCDASLTLQGINGVAGYDCRLRLTFSWLAAQPNTMTMRFANATLTAPVAPASRLDLLAPDAHQIGVLEAPPHLGASTSNQAYGLVWQHAHAGFRNQTESDLSARSCQPTADLMDALLTR